MSASPIADVGQFEPVALRKYALIQDERIASVTQAHGDSILRSMPGVEDVVDVTDEKVPIGPQWWYIEAAFYPPSEKRPTP